jgi:hypothetical protein
MFPRQQKIYYVESDEPFQSEPVIRGPFTHDDAMRLYEFNCILDCPSRLFRDDGGDQLVRA